MNIYKLFKGNTGAGKASVARRSSDERRKFLRTAVTGAGVVGVALSGVIPIVRGTAKRLRPPGALEEQDLLASCIKCGQCIQVCPVNALKPAGLLDGFGIGVPHLEPRKQACDFSCDVAQCILACPTGALVYHRPAHFPVRPNTELPASPVLLAKKDDPEPFLHFTHRMGLARLKNQEACLSVRGQGVTGSARGNRFYGKKRYIEVDRWKPQQVRNYSYQLERCDLCARECPIQGAITIEKHLAPNGTAKFVPEVHEACVGCGVCEMVCPVEPAAIVVDARQPWNAT